MAEDLQGPCNAGRREDAELLRIVDHHAIVLADAQAAHCVGEIFGRWQHVWVGRVLVFHIIQVEEAGVGDAAFFEGVDPRPAIVGQEPRRTERNDPRGGRKLAVYIFLEGRVQLGWGDNVRGECVLRHCASSPRQRPYGKGGEGSESGTESGKEHVGSWSGSTMVSSQRVGRAEVQWPGSVAL